ncbi:MAG TPA: translation initiation factor IF-5A [Candidatus Syntrophoarchaeum butanivorans]|uniref:Translation initiation factor 5A n=1 Tax=Candidatus Syntropharchaeum butanivorans TaxID=1839936 RepID=A0A1F2P3B6_9EURY|nr:MAG: Eukaryotic initiation factor 5A hypusine (eIF-5A) [Candidatus Syntrophoarchaeum butanivorans]RJS73266.1 MAG: translation initiation factor IF-5A [Candidatus Syntrophoarchaeum sp. WYZ-LMO15]HDM36672.1 translation initiation factor IF-5A [Candidatus Syntrophoarchaeum butanivorans]HEC57198.1 translation initiation factor IF-5A [Candidatus Syntrophoarchaeum butanivorans]
MKEQTEVRTLKKGKYIMVDDEPCVIIGLSTSKPGKHGSAKARIDAVGIFDNQKRSIVQPVTAKVYVPIVERRSGQVLSVRGNIVQLMDMEDYSTIEIETTDDMLEKIEVGKEIPYITSMGKYKIEIR